MTADSEKPKRAGRAGDGLSAPALGALYMVAATLGFTIMNVAIREASQELDPLQVVFFRNLFGMLFMLPWFVRAGTVTLRTPRLNLYLWRAIIGLGAMMLWFTSLAHLPLAEATALNFTAPLFATVAAALMLGEVVRARRWTATAIGFVGVLVILRPGFQELTLIMALPIIAAAFQAISIITVKKLSRTEPATAIVFFMNVLLTPLSLVPALFVWQWPSWWALGLVALIGFVGVFSHIAFTRAYEIADASAMLPFDYTKLPFVALFAYVLYGEIPDSWTWIGAGIIAVSSLYIAHREAVVARQRRASRVASQTPRASQG